MKRAPAHSRGPTSFPSLAYGPREADHRKRARATLLSTRALARAYAGVSISRARSPALRTHPSALAAAPHRQALV